MNTVHCFEHNCTEPTDKLWKANNFLYQNWNLPNMWQEYII